MLCVFYHIVVVTPPPPQGRIYGIWKFPGWGSNWNCSCRPMPWPEQSQIQAVLWPTPAACSNSVSLTHWARPGIKLASSWMLVRFITTEPQQELQKKKKNNFFKSSFRFRAKLKGSYRNFSNTPCSHTHITSPVIKIIHQNGSLFTRDGSTLTHHNHPKPTVYLKGYSCFGHSIALDTCIWHSSIIVISYRVVSQSWKPSVLCLFVSTLPSTGSHWSFYCLCSFAFSRMPYTWNHTACCLFWLLPLATGT